MMTGIKWEESDAYTASRKLPAHLSVMAGVHSGLRLFARVKATLAEVPLPRAATTNFNASAVREAMKLPEEELDLLNRLQHKPGEKIQHAYITAAQGLKYATVNQMMEARRLPLLTSQQQSGASDWLKCAPFTKELHLSPEEYCWSVEKLLGMHTTFDETAASCTSCTTTQTKETTRRAARLVACRSRDTMRFCSCWRNYSSWSDTAWLSRRERCMRVRAMVAQILR